MKFTITHRNKKNQLLVSTKSLERFLERIVNDDAKNTVENFREYVPWLTNGYDGYKDTKEEKNSTKINPYTHQ